MTCETTPSLAARLVAGAAPGAVALVEGATAVTYAELAGRVADRAAELPLGGRSVVVLTGPASAEWVVTYLALLDAGHVPLLAGDHVERLAGAWAPAAVVTVDGGVAVDRRPAAPADLHPDLALLLSTSGSTGSPKLARLSQANVLANARAIAAALGLSASDRGVTALPLHYCYGLSVLHSHLAAGASVVATTASVVDPCFAAALRDHGVTNVAGVPHTFELLERAGPERLRAPSLRFVTQAGGRMAPEALARWRSRLAGWGADLVVMYGQTEATARMAVLPPALAAVAPGSIGVPVPGGELEVRPLDGRGDGVGELVYRGPNVMLGYATAPADLALGATLTELRTGDLGRLDAEHGVFEVVGRLSRFVKPYGLRVDLDALEARLAAGHGPVAATGDDELVVVAAPGADPDALRAAARQATTLPDAAVAVLVDDELPRTAAGKVDHPELLRRARDAQGGDDGAPSVAAVFASVLGQPAIDPASTFVDAGGDSLSYVECALRLERILGPLPDDWHLRPVAELEALDRSERVARVDTTVVLRALGISTVVATHMDVAYFPGGAHLLLAVAGFNLSRFQLSIGRAGDRVRAGLRTVGRVAVPTVAWAVIAFLISDSYGLTTLGLVNNYLGPRGHQDGYWHFWFVEAFVQILLGATLLLAVPAVRRVERRWPYVFALGLLVATVQLRGVTWGGLDDPMNLRFRTHGIAWFFVLGWLVHRSDTVPKKALTTVAAALVVPGFFDRPQREWFIIVGLVLLTWCRQVPFPRPLVPAASALAAASMWILISHFQIWPPLDRLLPLGIAYPATVLAGVGAWAVAERVPRRVRTAVHRRGAVQAEAASSDGRTRSRANGTDSGVGVFSAVADA